MRVASRYSPFALPLDYLGLAAHLITAPHVEGILMEESRRPVYRQLFPTRCNNGGDTCEL